MLKPYVVRTIVLSRADGCLRRRNYVLDLRWSADQAEYRRPPAERAQFDDGAMDGDPHGARQKPRHCRNDDRWPARRECPRCGRSAETGADAVWKCLGGFHI